jgi:hypothetical protein
MSDIITLAVLRTDVLLIGGGEVFHAAPPQGVPA